MKKLITMNVTDLRRKLRRAPLSQVASEALSERRKVSDRRIQQMPMSDIRTTADGYNRVWLTRGERNLIEDLYLLDPK